MKNKKFNIDQFNSVVNEWRVDDFYSDIFKATICSLLSVNQ